MRNGFVAYDKSICCTDARDNNMFATFKLFATFCLFLNTMLLFLILFVTYPLCYVFVDTLLECPPHKSPKLCPTVLNIGLNAVDGARRW